MIQREKAKLRNKLRAIFYIENKTNNFYTKKKTTDLPSASPDEPLWYIIKNAYRCQ